MKAFSIVIVTLTVVSASAIPRHEAELIARHPMNGIHTAQENSNFDIMKKSPSKNEISMVAEQSDAAYHNKEEVSSSDEEQRTSEDFKNRKAVIDEKRKELFEEYLNIHKQVLTEKQREDLVKIVRDKRDKNSEEFKELNNEYGEFLMSSQWQIKKIVAQLDDIEKPIQELNNKLSKFEQDLTETEDLSEVQRILNDRTSGTPQELLEKEYGLKKDVVQTFETLNSLPNNAASEYRRMEYLWNHDNLEHDGTFGNSLEDKLKSIYAAIGEMYKFVEKGKSAGIPTEAEQYIKDVDQIYENQWDSSVMRDSDKSMSASWYLEMIEES